MIFKKLNVLLATTVLSFGFASGALASDNNSGPGITLNVMGAAAIGGNGASNFEGTTGFNQVNQSGETRTDVESTLSGFCAPGDCGNTTFTIDLLANQEGYVETTAAGETSEADVAVLNGGVYNSTVQAGIDFGGNTTNISTQGASGFGNSGIINATGSGHVNSSMEAWGGGQTTSNLNTNGTVCASCADWNGGTTTMSNSGINLMSTASGGSSGLQIGIGTSALSESAAGMSSTFNQSANQ